MFTAKCARDAFHEHAGVDFHPTVPGQLIARQRAMKTGLKTTDNRVVYYPVYWKQLWADMMELAKKRSQYGENPAPIECDPPPVPSVGYVPDPRGFPSSLRR